MSAKSGEVLRPFNFIPKQHREATKFQYAADALINRHITQHISKENTMSRSANDDRSDSMNPNNDAYEDSMDNRSNQLNPNHDEYRGGSDDDQD